MEVNKQGKLIFPVTLDDPKEDFPLVGYSIHSDGIYMHKRISGNNIIKVKVNGISGLSKGSENINILKRKIPFNIFWEIVNFFRYVRSHFNSNLEAYAIIGYSNSEGKYCIWIPKQTVATAQVKYDISEFHKDYPGYYIVSDWHCHPGEGAYFSGQDNEDDNRDRFSGVIGNLDKLIPNYVVRFSANGKFWDFKLDDIFEETSETFKLDFAKEIKKISTQEKSNNSIGFVERHSYRSSGWLDKYLNEKKDNKEFKLSDLLEDW